MRAASSALVSLRSVPWLPDIVKLCDATDAMEALRSADQLTDSRSRACAASGASSAENYDLAAEVQKCAIKLLALLKEDEPDLEISNREKFAWDLACAEFDFLIDMLRLTGRITDLYSHTSSASTDRFTEFRQRD